MPDRTPVRPGNAGRVTYWPDHFGPMTWAQCIEPGCTARVDPWDHNTRCPEHRPDDPDTLVAELRRRRRERMMTSDA